MKLDRLEIPSLPGIYRFYNESESLIYVGKAKNLKRRLSQYQNAKRRKAHAKMRKIVKEAKRLEFEICENEFAALALENQWIQNHRPKWNVAGAFFFLYPMVGLHIQDGLLHLCYTTTPEKFPLFSFHGSFRSRKRVKEGFFALTELLTLIGHRMSKSQLSKSGLASPSNKLGYVIGFRQIPENWLPLLEKFFNGEAFTAIEELSLLLLERPSALAKSDETQDLLYAIRRFWRHEILTLKKARKQCEWKTYPVSQKDRDLIFIALKSKGLIQHSDYSNTG